MGQTSGRLKGKVAKKVSIPQASLYLLAERPLRDHRGRRQPQPCHLLAEDVLT